MVFLLRIVSFTGRVYRMNAKQEIQGVFDFAAGNANGYDNWLRQEEARMEAIRKEWGVHGLGRMVRLRLRDFSREFTGKLELAEHPARIDHRLPLALRICGVDLTRDDIEQCSCLS